MTANVIADAVECIVCVSPFAALFGLAAIVAGIWEHIDYKKELQQAKEERHKDDEAKLEYSKQQTLLYYDTLTYPQRKGNINGEN